MNVVIIIVGLELVLHGRLRREIENKIDATAVNRFCEVVVPMFPEYITQGFLTTVSLSRLKS